MLTTYARGSATVLATAPGVAVAQVISVPGMLSTDSVTITCKGSTADGRGSNPLYVTSVTADSFTVASERPQLAQNVDIDFCITRGTE